MVDDVHADLGGGVAADTGADAPVEVEAVEALPGEVVDGGHADTAAIDLAAVELMTKEEFAGMFLGLFPVVGGVIGQMRPPALRSLTEVEQLPTARPASDALYRLAMRFPWLRWLLDKDAQMYGDLIVIAAFGMQLRAAIVAEIGARTVTDGGE